MFYFILALALASLLLSEVAWRYQPSANFFLAPTRAWELLAGSLCALISLDRAPIRSNLLSALGLLLIVWAIFLFDEHTPFPSIYALVPVIGACLLLLFGHRGTATAWVLSRQAVVGLGLISYSAYLWHQPLFAFARMRSIEPPSAVFMASLACASLALAYISWRYIERPFRSKQIPLLTRPMLFSASFVAGAGLISLGVSGYLANGFPQRFAPDVTASASAASDKGEFNQCFAGLAFDDLARLTNSCHSAFGTGSPTSYCGAILMPRRWRMA